MVGSLKRSFQESPPMFARLWLVLILLLPATCPAKGLSPGTLLSYRGTIAPLSRDRTASEPQKTFDLLIILADAEDGGHRLCWTTEERGRGAWPWVERFGSITVDKLWKQGQRSGPTLLYDLGEAKSAVAIPLPLLGGGPLAAGAEWQDGGWSFAVQRATQMNDLPVWQVQVSNSYGPKRTLWVDKQSPLAVAITERVFMGMGQEFQLELKLVGTETLPVDAFSRAIAAFDGLLETRTRMNLPGRKETVDFNDTQRKLLAEQLPKLEANAKGTPLEKIVRSAQRDVGQQNDRADAVSKLAEETVGRAVPEFNLEGLNQESLTQKDLQGKVTVLHFWEYRDSPLQEPYGQVGYLDFLSQRRKAEGVQVYGVAVDGRLADKAERSQATRGIRKLKAFMNLSYPILLDGGSLIREFGDPRPAGAELPLFVVIGPDGKIAHHHAGFYQVDRNDGLKELNQIVTEALRKRDAK